MQSKTVMSMIYKKQAAMKTTIKKILFATAISALTVSCAKEIASPIENIDEQLVEVTIIAGNPEVSPATKTEMVGSQPYWSVNDAIGVSNGTNTNYKFSTDIAAKATSASFTGTTAVSSTLYAYYPFTNNGVGQVSEKNGAKVDLPANQNPTATSFDGSADVMVAKQFTVDPENTTVEDLEFARLGAVVKIVLIDKDNTMTGTQHPTTVSMTAESTLAGRLLIDMQNQDLSEPYYNQSSTVTANYTSETKYAIDGSNATYLIVYPQTLAEGTTLTIAASTEDYSLSKDITVPEGGIELLPGKLTTLNVKFAATHITSDAGAALPFNDDMSWADNGSSDSGTDIGTSIASAENSNGLYITGEKAYKGKGGLKLGTGSYSGSVTTKELNLSGAFYIAIESGKYGSDTGTLEVTVDETKVITGASLDGFNFVNIAAGTYTKKSKVTIATSSKRGYIYSVDIVSGSYVVPPVINVTTDNPMAVANTASTQTIAYTIVNPTAAALTATLQDPDDTWISNIDCSTSGEVTFDVAAQSAGDPARSAVIVLSYTGAPDVEVEVNQAAGSGGKTEYTATLAISSGVTSNGTLKDDKGNSWSLTAVTEGWTSSNSYIHIGSNKKAATSITLTTSAYSSVDIKEIHVWAAAKASSNVTTKISIDGTLLGTSAVLGNTIDSGGTEFSITNTDNKSGDITVEISRPSSATGAIYFKKLEVVYEN